MLGWRVLVVGGLLCVLGGFARGSLLVAFADEPDNPQLFKPEEDFPPPLNPELLAKVQDSKPLPSIDPKKLDAQGRELDEYEAFCEALLTAYQHSPQSFAKNARKDLTYAHIYQEPRRYRGQIVSFEGRLKRVRRYDAPETARRAGLLDYYEGWLFDDKRIGAHPICIVFPRLPEGVEAAEEMEYPVTFAGYFFKKYRYDATNGQKHDVPLIVGHGPVLRSTLTEAAPPENWTRSMLYGLLGFIGAVMVLGIGVGWWYSRSEGQVRRRLTEAAAQQFAEQQDESST